MGSTFTEIDSGSAFDRYFRDERSQTMSFGISAPLTPDRKTYGAYSLDYDFEEGAFTKQSIAISRQLHCLRVSGVFSIERERDDDDEAETDTSFSEEMDSVNYNQIKGQEMKFFFDDGKLSEMQVIGKQA